MSNLASHGNGQLDGRGSSFGAACFIERRRKPSEATSRCIRTTSWCDSPPSLASLEYIVLRTCGVVLSVHDHSLTVTRCAGWLSSPKPHPRSWAAAEIRPERLGETRHASIFPLVGSLGPQAAPTVLP